MPKAITLLTNSAEIFILEDIDSSGFGFTAEELKQQLSTLPPDSPITVHINSIGGEVFEGLTIYSMLRTWKGPVTTIIDGIAASISGIIFLAGDKRLIQEHGMFMLHNPHFGPIPGGTSKEIRENADEIATLVEKNEETVRAIYRRTTSLDESTLMKMLDKDTYLSASEAIKFGFATELVEMPVLEARTSLRKLVASLPKTFLNSLKGAYTVNPFDKWLAEYCEPLKMKAEELDEDQIKTLKARWEKEKKTPPPRPKVDPVIDDDDDDKIAAKRLAARRKAEAAEDDRCEGIHLYAKQNDSELNPDYLKEIGVKATTSRGLVSHAIRENWTQDKFELEMRRAERPSMGDFAIHSAPDKGVLNHKAISAAMLRQTGIPEKEIVQIPGSTRTREWGFSKMYDEKDLEASHQKHIKDMSLQQVLGMAFREANGYSYQGRTNTDGFISSVRESLWKLRASTGTTTWSGLNIFDDLANKLLWARYDAVPTTWQEWVKQMPVNDFKVHNTYRLTGKGTYQQVGADGELRHGQLTDDRYQHSADTYGKLVGLDRRDIINDDLGALSDMMGMLGEEGSLFLEELFYVHLLGRLGTIFPTAGTNKNYISGSATTLDVTGLGTGEKTLADQVNADSAPILMGASLLLVGTTLAVQAGELFTQTQLQGVQTANTKKRPDGNPHVGKFRPIMSPYVDNTNILQRITSIGDAIPGQSPTQWLLFRPPGPSGGIVIGSFLNGNVRPIVEQGDLSFDKLGLQWRAYHDAGADDGDPKWGLHSKGAA